MRQGEGRNEKRSFQSAASVVVRCVFVCFELSKALVLINIHLSLSLYETDRRTHKHKAKSAALHFFFADFFREFLAVSVFANSSEKKDNELMNESLEALFHCDIFFREK